MSSLIRKLSFQRVSEILGIELDDVRALVVEERLMPAIYVTQAGYSEPYGLQLLKVDADGRAFDLAVGGINGAVHTGFLRIERDALDRFILDEGFTRAQSPATVKADGSSKNVAHANPIPAPATAQDEMVHPQAAPSPAPVSAEPVEPAPIDAPDPLTTGDIAFCFDGLRWTEQEWKKPLGDKPKWLQSCIAIPGKRGVHETRWNPVSIGAALVQNGHAKPNSVRARFQSKPQLSPWYEAWKTYEADYLDTE